MILDIFEHPNALYALIPLIPVLIFLIRRNFVSLKDDDPRKTSKLYIKRVIVFLSRVVIFGCIIIAIASPFTIKEVTTDGNPRIVMLVDNSTSFQIFNAEEADNLKKSLETRIPVEVKTIGYGLRSDISDSILRNVNANDNVLLISDGNNNYGRSLGDMAMFLSTNLNVTLSAVKLEPEKMEAGVTIFGPDETVANLDNEFAVRISRNRMDSVPLKITVDGAVVYDKATSDETVPVVKKFSDGTHTITAEIKVDDYFSQNNIFYKTIKVVEKPKVLFLSGGPSSLYTILDQLYDVDRKVELPSDLSPYYAIVVDNMAAKKMDEYNEELNDYLNEGNGLVVFGGANAYDDGGYEGSLFETLLPLRIDPEKELPSDVAIVIVVDASESVYVGTTEKGNIAGDVQKAIAVDLIDDLKPNDLLGVVAFNYEAFLISPMSKVKEKDKTLAPDILTIKNEGETHAEEGLLKAYTMLAGLKGSRNIILVSDGRIFPSQSVPRTMAAAEKIGNEGIKVYTVGVGSITHEGYMQGIAAFGNGQYFKMDESKNLHLVFGKTSKTEGTGVNMDMVVLNKNHFITQGLALDGKIQGFNFVWPKASAQVLVTTSNGDPLVAAWRFGLGRVVGIATDNGKEWAKMLYNKKNSRLVSRSMNWAIGNPHRNANFYASIPDTNVGEETAVSVISKSKFISQEIELSRVDEKQYLGYFTPETEGFLTLLNVKFASNYPKEYMNPGFNQELYDVTSTTGGKVYGLEEVDSMVQDVISKSKRTDIVKDNLSWIFAAIAAIVFLAELAARRVFEFMMR